MAIADADALKVKVGNLLGTAWSGLEADAQDEAVVMAMDELGFSFPTTTSKQSFWATERTKRHALYIVVVSQAERFKYKQINLQQKFDHYFKIIEKADKAFASAIENDVSGTFPIELTDGDDFAVYGFLMNPAGFVYDQLGRDLTYDYS